MHRLEDSKTIRDWDEQYGLLSKLETQAGKLPRCSKDAA